MCVMWHTFSCILYFVIWITDFQGTTFFELTTCILRGSSNRQYSLNVTRMDIRISYLLSHNITVRKHTIRSKYWFNYTRSLVKRLMRMHAFISPYFIYFCADIPVLHHISNTGSHIYLNSFQCSDSQVSSLTFRLYCVHVCAVIW